MVCIVAQSLSIMGNHHPDEQFTYARRFSRSLNIIVQIGLLKSKQHFIVPIIVWLLMMVGIQTVGMLTELRLLLLKCFHQSFYTHTHTHTCPVASAGPPSTSPEADDGSCGCPEESPRSRWSPGCVVLGEVMDISTAAPLVWPLELILF